MINQSFSSIILIVLFIFSGKYSSAQCGVSPSLCYSSEPFPSINFGISEHFQSQANTTVYQDPLIIDTDGDCIPEIIMSGTTGYTNSPRKTSGITIASSLNGSTISSFPTCFYSWTNALAYAAGDINNDGIPELIVAAINHSSNPLNQRGRLICYSMSGNILWISNQQFGLNTISHYDATPLLADFNGDGIPEVYAHNQLFNAQTGEHILDGGANGIGMNVYVPGICENSIPIAGDLDNNPNDLELAAGYSVYDITITNIHGTTGNTMIPHNILVDGNYRDGFTSLADINLDGKLDVVVSSLGTETTSRLYAYYLNAALTPVLIAKTAMPRGTSAPYSEFSGPPYIGDLDGSGTPTICVTRNYRMIAYTYNGSTSFQQKWILNTVDQSGCTGITSFDFDQNGIQEIVFRDENNLQILNGNGTTATTLSSINCASLTVNDMAIVGDIDHSGQARICVTCGSENNAKVIVYESNTSDGWAPARGIWNQYAYHVSNIEDNGSVPVQQQNNAGSPLSNNFYIQSTLLDNNGSYIIPAADASITIDCITNNLATGNLEITYTLSNSPQSSKAILPGCSVYIYNSGPLTGAAPTYSATVNTAIPPGQSYSGTIVVSAALFSNTNITLLANGNGTAINGSYNSTHFDQTECDYSNNIGTGTILSMTAGTDLSLCSLQPVLLDASLYLPFSGTWELVNGAGTFSDIHAYNAEFTPSGTQNITLQWTMSQGNCALAIDQVQLVFQSTPLPVITNTLICIGDSIQTGYSDPNYTYEWAFQNWISDIYTGAPYFSPTTTSYATVTATNTISGCIVTDSILIEVYGLPQFTIPADDTLCSGQSITLAGWGSPDISLSWGNGETNPYTVTPSTGIHYYILEAASPQGCISSDTVTIVVYPSPTAAFSYSPEIILENEEVVNTVNHSENASNYIWYVNNYLLSEETNLSFTSDQDQTSYTIQLIAFNESGCSDTVVRKITCFVDNLVFVPNAFTPDGNSTNNTFSPVFFKPEDVQEYKMEIFDRWGELIFKSESSTEYWDGTYKGKMAQDGIYTWKLHLYDNTSGKDVDWLGHVTLLR